MTSTGVASSKKTATQKPKAEDKPSKYEFTSSSDRGKITISYASTLMAHRYLKQFLGDHKWTYSKDGTSATCSQTGTTITGNASLKALIAWKNPVKPNKDLDVPPFLERKIEDYSEEAKAAAGRRIKQEVSARNDNATKLSMPRTDVNKDAPKTGDGNDDKPSKKKMAPGDIPLKAICRDANIEPREARRKLRSAVKNRKAYPNLAESYSKNARWAWPDGSKELAEVKQALGIRVS